MAPLPPSNDRKLSSTLKLYNSTNEPLQLDLAATSSFSLAFGPAITEAFSTSSATISTALSAKQVEFSINGITFRVDSPNSCTKGWISLDREPTTSRLLPPIERRTREDEKSVVKVLRFLVYQLNDVRVQTTTIKNAADSVELVVIPAIPLNSWTSLLPDSTNLSEVYIPGTHESMALFGYPHSTCQYDPSETALAPSLRPTPAPPIGNITNQLRNGVRFLDLRFSLFPVKSKSTTNSRFFVDRSIIAKATSEEEVNSSVAEEWELRGYHGIINQKITAIEAFEEIYQFLDAAVGRGETIIVSIKQENSTDSTAFAQAVHSLIDAPRTRSRWYTEPRWPELSEVRGKIVLFCRFQHWGAKGGLHSPRWDDSSNVSWETEVGGQKVVVQDWYKISSFKNITQKANLVLSLFDSSDFPAVTTSSSFALAQSHGPTDATTVKPEFRRSISSFSSAASSSTDSSLLARETKTTVAPILKKRAIRINFTSGASFPFFPPILVARGVGSILTLSLRSPLLSVRADAARNDGAIEKRRRMRLTRRVEGVNELILTELLRRSKARLSTDRQAEGIRGGGMMILTDYVKLSDGFTQLIIALNEFII